MTTTRVNTATGELLTIGHGRLPSDPPEVITHEQELPRYPLEELKYEGGQIVRKPGAERLAARKIDAKQAVDNAAGATRARFVTSAAYQETVYRLKQEQAQAYADAGYTGDAPPLVQSEADAQEITAQAAADFILATAAGWIAVVARIETIRRTAIRQIEAASDPAVVETIQASARAQLAAIQPE